MKRRISLVLLVAFFSLNAPVVFYGQKGQILLPINPGELLKFMPTAEPGWVMSSSTAEHVLDTYPLSSAKRIFTRQKAENLPANEVAAVADTGEKLEVFLVDMADNRHSVEHFEKSKAPSAKRVAVGKLSGFRVPLEGEADRVEVLIQERIVLVFVLTSGSKDTVDKWLDKIDTDGLEKLAAEKAWYSAKKDYDFTKEYINELDPKKYRKTIFSLSPIDPDPKAKDEPEPRSEPQAEQPQAE
jgi:hypothetical protein